MERAIPRRHRRTTLSPSHSTEHTTGSPGTVRHTRHKCTNTRELSLGSPPPPLPPQLTLYELLDLRLPSTPYGRLSISRAATHAPSSTRNPTGTNICDLSIQLTVTARILWRWLRALVASPCCPGGDMLAGARGQHRRQEGVEVVCICKGCGAPGRGLARRLA